MSSIRVLISMPEDFLKQIDTQAEKEMRTRSEFLREVVRKYLGEQK